MTIHAKRALLGKTWAKNVRVTVTDGCIDGVFLEQSPQSEDTEVDTLLPALANLHSHAFQRAMAGMTEFRAAGKESFWTWRDLMYRFLDHLSPDQVEAIAALVFMEMQKAGYASVGEFHYVHHQPGGRSYDTLSELSQRIFAAAQETGIGLTHLPVLYTYGGVNQEPLTGGQLRFSNDVARFLRLVQDCESQLQSMPADCRIGIAPHSLRATSPADLAEVLTQRPEGPVHIHISEQLKEVVDVEAKLGQRPVSWLLDNAEVNNRWCLIHATHMTDEETVAMAQSGAVAGLCPITEANLGDGIFNGVPYLNNGGAFGLGSDSNVRISLTEELRTLEYSQRLRDKARNVLADEAGSTGKTLYTKAAKGGALALNRQAGEIGVGQLADLVAIDSTHPTLFALNDAQLLDGLCFAAGDEVVTDTWSAGRHVVKSGHHVAQDHITRRFKRAMRGLLDAV
ncbi:formimidoylglutamate deiminase [uncultured Shimia sp.]|uniref:formimidoylglutamate deiminase n=1 Tax=uncultured Shimia sp. TaxID=573152 RepID=UPI00261A416C|nr:formimidoylglutamate deiminase [uncultured Shimia sp.]